MRGVGGNQLQAVLKGDGGYHGRGEGKKGTGGGKGTSLNSDSLTPKLLASSVYVRVPEAHCPQNG